MPRNNIICDQCEKYIGDEKLAWFSDREKDLDFCSEGCYSEWNATTWTDIHPDFTRELQEEWEEWEFDYEGTAQWIKAGLVPSESKFAYWLQELQEEKSENIGNYPDQNFADPQWIKDNADLEQLRAEFDKQGEESEEEYIDAKKWLDDEYPDKEERTKIEELEIDDYLEGELDLSDFVNLVKLDCNKNKLTSLNISGLNELEEINCSDNNLKNLDVSKCQKLKIIDCSDNDLTEINLPENSTSLTELNCEYNELKELEIENCPNLKRLDCSDNLLVNLDLSKNLDLRELDIRNNNFEKKDLSFLRCLTNLEVLQIGNYDLERSEIEGEQYNRFFGSLRDLESLILLKELDISNTNVDSGLEFLPKSVKSLNIDLDSSKFKVSSIRDQLEDYMKEDEQGYDYYDYQAWREDSDQGSWKESRRKYLKAIKEMAKKTSNKKFVRTKFQELADEFTENWSRHLVAYKDDICAGKQTTSELYLSLKQGESGFEEVTNALVSLLQNYGASLEKLGEENLNKDSEEYLNSLRYAYDAIFAQEPERSSEIETEINCSLSNLSQGDDAVESKEDNFINPVLHSFDIFFNEIDEGEESTKLSKSNIKKMLTQTKISFISNFFQQELDKIKKSREKKVKLAPNIPNILAFDHKKESDDYNLSTWKQNGYNYVYPDTEILKREIENYKKSLSEDEKRKEKLPLRLFNIKEKKVEEITEEVKEKYENNNFYSYAILSYVWGKTESNERLSQGGKKSLAKAIKTCELLNTKYLWMDQLCINQSSTEEKDGEVPKMRDYYSNSSVTLVAIHKNINEQNSSWVSEKWDNDSLKVLKKIINSEWFSRSWTFQEGWLSKQTIFMFDDYLIDGSLLAQVWAFNQLADVDGKYSSRREFDDKSVKIATPVGWARYKNGYKCGDKIEMSLHEALKGVKGRGQVNAVDGIYSTLGLLPYGSEVNPSYKPRICPDCPNKKEIKDCKHEEKNKQWPTYTEEELEKELMKVMKEGLKKGYAEPLAWHGSGDNWIPHIDKYGSTEVRGGIDIKCEKNVLKKNRDSAIKFKAKKYLIVDIDNITGVGGDTVLGGIYSGTVKLSEEKKPKKESRITKEIKVWGLGETLKELSNIKGERFLVIPDEKEIRSANVPFAILVLESNSFLQRIGLVELEEEDIEELNEMDIKKKDVRIDFIDPIRQSIIELNRSNNDQAQIQVPPKGNS